MTQFDLILTKLKESFITLLMFVRWILYHWATLEARIHECVYILIFISIYILKIWINTKTFNFNPTSQDSLWSCLCLHSFIFLLWQQENRFPLPSVSSISHHRLIPPIWWCLPQPTWALSGPHSYMEAIFTSLGSDFMGQATHVWILYSPHVGSCFWWEPSPLLHGLWYQADSWQESLLTPFAHCDRPFNFTDALINQFGFPMPAPSCLGDFITCLVSKIPYQATPPRKAYPALPYLTDLLCGLDC